MQKYSMKCTCGDVMAVDAPSKDEAVDKIKEMMNEEAVNAHFAEKHPGQPVPPMDQVAMMIEQTVMEGETGEAGQPAAA